MKSINAVQNKITHKKVIFLHILKLDRSIDCKLTSV